LKKTKNTNKDLNVSIALYVITCTSHWNDYLKLFI